MNEVDNLLSNDNLDGLNTIERETIKANVQPVADSRDEAIAVLRRLVDALPLPDPLGDDPEAVAKRETNALLERHGGGW